MVADCHAVLGQAGGTSPPLKEKACGKCRQVKPAMAYHLNRSKPTGLGSWCKDCATLWYRARPCNAAPKVAAKKCTGCGAVKPAGAFHRQARLPTGLRIYCKECERERCEPHTSLSPPADTSLPFPGRFWLLT